MFGPSSTGVERRYAPAEATVVIGKIAFEFPIHWRRPKDLADIQTARDNPMGRTIQAATVKAKADMQTLTISRCTSAHVRWRRGKSASSRSKSRKILPG